MIPRNLCEIHSDLIRRTTVRVDYRFETARLQIHRFSSASLANKGTWKVGHAWFSFYNLQLQKGYPQADRHVGSMCRSTTFKGPPETNPTALPGLHPLRWSLCLPVPQCHWQRLGVNVESQQVALDHKTGWTKWNVEKNEWSYWSIHKMIRMYLHFW